MTKNFSRLPHLRPSFVKIPMTSTQSREASQRAQDICNIIPARFPSTVKITGTNFLTVNILNRREIPHRLESHNERILFMARCPYDILTSVAQRKILHTARRPYDVLTTVAQRTYSQTSPQRTDHSHTTKTNLLRSYATLAS